MNTIPDVGRWKDISAEINANFNLLDMRLRMLGVMNKGKFSSAEALIEAYPQSTIGSYACVGEVSPYALWVYGESGWADSGETSELGGFDIASLPIADSTTNGLMSIAHVNELNSLQLALSTVRALGNAVAPPFDSETSMTYSDTLCPVSYTKVFWNGPSKVFCALGSNGTAYNRWVAQGEYPSSDAYNDRINGASVFRKGGELWYLVDGAMKKIGTNIFVEGEMLVLE